MGQKGKSLPFLIDTGALHTSMSMQVLEEIGLTIPEMPELSSWKQQTAVGL